jgi:hypothetical protein
MPALCFDMLTHCTKAISVFTDPALQIYFNQMTAPNKTRHVLIIAGLGDQKSVSETITEYCLFFHGCHTEYEGKADLFSYFAIP